VSRPLRITVENDWYHVLDRGIDGRWLFPDDRANEHFLELLKSMPAWFNLRIHALVLTGNHYRLQIETLKPDLSRAIQWLNLSFSAWYNRLHRRRGPLFQGRFKAVLHDPEESALIINRYIHLNPVRIKRLGGHEVRPGAEQRLGPAAEEVDKELVRARVAALNSCRWSSYPAYVGKVKTPDWLSTEAIRNCSVAVRWKASGQPTGVNWKNWLECSKNSKVIAGNRPGCGKRSVLVLSGQE